MPVEITQKEIEYTWDGYTGAWDDNEDTWDEATMLGYEALASEGVSLSGTAVKNAAATVKEQVKASDAASKAASLAGLLERIAVTDAFSYNRLLSAAVNEVISLSDKAAKNADLGLKERLTAADEMLHAAVFWRSFAENLQVESTANKALTSVHKEALAFLEYYTKGKIATLLESIAVEDELSRKAVYGREFKEALKLTAQHGRTPVKNFAELLGLSERLPGREIAKNFAERLRARESFTTDKSKNIHEYIAVEEVVTKAFARTLLEAVTLADLFGRDYARAVFERLRFSDSFNKSHKATRSANEIISLAEELKDKTAAKSFEEALNLYDALVRACEGVLSDIAINSGEMSLEDFTAIVKTVPGYAPFMDFKVGEYEYKDALVRIAVGSVVAQTEPSVNNVVMHVDIPDTQDRGTAEIEDTEAPTKVFFNKMFYNPPEVSVNLRGGNTGDGLVVPNIVSTDKKDEYGARYFEVELLNSNMQRVTGLVTWQAVGY